MFGRTEINIDMIVTTSKIALKASCMRACNNDIDKAEKLYEFFIKDIKEMPDFDVIPPTTFDQIKSIAGDVFTWVDQNQDKIVGAYNFIQTVRSGQSIVPTAPPAPPIQGIPPIPE